MPFLKGVSRKRLMPVAGLLVMLLSLAVVLYSGGTAVTRGGVGQCLQRFADYVAQEAARNGRDGTFAYGDITLHGWGFGRSATIDKVSLELAQRSVLETRRWSLSTTQMEVEPDPARAGHLIFIFSEPVNVIENSQLKTTLSFPSPPTYSYFNGLDGGVHVIRHVLQLPPKIVLTPANTADTSEETTKGVTISYDDRPTVQVTVLPGTGERQAQYEFHNVRIATDDGIEAAAAALSSRFSEAPAGQGKVKGQYTLLVTDLALHDKDVASHTYNLNADMAFTGDAPPPGKKPAAGSTTEVTLKRLAIGSSDFNVSATGTVTLSADDPLPFGSITLDIDDVQKFIASELVPAQGRQALLAALQKAAGQPAAALTHVSLPVKREKNGVLYVGNITFEELATTMLADMMKPTAAAPAPAAPAAAPSPQAAPPAPATEAK